MPEAKAMLKFDPPALARFISEADLEALIDRARTEDMGRDARDITSEALIPPERSGRAAFRVRKPGVVAGLGALPVVVRVYDRQLQLEARAHDGEGVPAGHVIAHIAGPLRPLLALERVALNVLAHLSGIATTTALFVREVKGTKARICDTRKTLPGLRMLQKYAVVCGGGLNHRIGLHDAVLVKDNHVAHLGLGDLGQALAEGVRRVRRNQPPPEFVQVEVDTLAQLEEVLDLPADARPDMVLLDNLGPESLRAAVGTRDRLAPPVLLEASGGINLHNVRAIAETGVDRISIGALTHSAPALDIGLDLE